MKELYVVSATKFDNDGYMTNHVHCGVTNTMPKAYEIANSFAKDYGHFSGATIDTVNNKLGIIRMYTPDWYIVIDIDNVDYEEA